MDIETLLAVGEVMQAAAHKHGVVGPVEFSICPIHPSEREQDHRGELAIDTKPDPTAEHFTTRKCSAVRSVARPVRREFQTNKE